MAKQPERRPEPPVPVTVVKAAPAPVHAPDAGQYANLPPRARPQHLIEAGVTPRFCDPMERVPPHSDVKRYKIRITGIEGLPYKYVLAASDEEAVQYYREQLKVNDMIEALVAEAAPMARPIRHLTAITELAD